MSTGTVPLSWRSYCIIHGRKRMRVIELVLLVILAMIVPNFAFILWRFRRDQYYQLTFKDFTKLLWTINIHHSVRLFIRSFCGLESTTTRARRWRTLSLTMLGDTSGFFVDVNNLFRRGRVEIETKQSQCGNPVKLAMSQTTYILLPRGCRRACW